MAVDHQCNHDGITVLVEENKNEGGRPQSWMRSFSDPFHEDPKLSLPERVRLHNIIGYASKSYNLLIDGVKLESLKNQVISQCSRVYPRAKGISPYLLPT